jgi:uncharacterized iron-regulated membrane protein
LRRLAARAHFWGGLLTGPLVVVLGLSGAALVFRAELDEALGGPPAIAAGGPVRALDAIVAAALLSEPGGEARALRIPARRDRPYRVEIVRGARRVDVAVDPVTLRVVDSRVPERSVLMAVHSLHAAFHAGAPGAVVVGVLGLALVAESVTGLWLYGPSLRRRGRGPRPRGRSRGLHRLVGAVTLALTLVVGLTGVALALAGGVAVAAPPPAPGALARLDALAARALAAVPGGTLASLVAVDAGHVRAEARVGSERTVAVLLERATGAVVAAPPAASGGAWDLVRRLHAGDFAGWLSRLAYALTGLALPALSITGYLAATRPRASS